jgi:hypothetical protein
MLELFLNVLRAGNRTIGMVIPERDFGASFHVAGRAYDHHVAYKCAAGVTITAVVDIRCMRPDAA